MKNLLMVIAASTLMLTGCDKAPPKTKTEKTSVISKSDAPLPKKPKTQTASTESTASVKQSDLSAPTHHAVYAQDAVQPFDALVYGTFSRADKIPLKNAKLVLRTSLTDNFNEIKRQDYVTVPLPPNGRYKIAVNKDRAYYAEISGDNITTGTSTLYKTLFARSTPKSTSGVYKAEVNFDAVFPGTDVIEGKVVDGKGNPIPNTFIAFAYSPPKSSTPSSPGIRIGTSETTSTEDGTFRLQNAPVGTGTLFAKAPDFMPINLPSVQVPTSEPLTLTMNQKGASLTGRVLQLDTESPIENAAVSLIPQDSPEWTDVSGSLIKYLTATSDSAGNFEINNIPPFLSGQKPVKKSPLWLNPLGSLNEKLQSNSMKVRRRK